MSGIGPSELIVLVVVGLLILGPERLPRVATQIGRWIGRARRTANQLRYQLEREITLADIEEKKKKDEKKKGVNNPDADDSSNDTKDHSDASDSAPADDGGGDAPATDNGGNREPADQAAKQSDDEAK